MIAINTKYVLNLIPIKCVNAKCVMHFQIMKLLIPNRKFNTTLYLYLLYWYVEYRSIFNVSALVIQQYSTWLHFECY